MSDQLMHDEIISLITEHSHLSKSAQKKVLKLVNQGFTNRETLKDTERLNNLRSLLGYVSNNTTSTVVIYIDPVTEEFSLNSSKLNITAQSFRALLDNIPS